MNLLIDTHILLWWLADHPALSIEARSLISNAKNLIFVSTASVWEIIIKKSIGKLKAPDDIEKVLQENNFKELSMTLEHVLMIGNLPNHHHDPFDRMLIAQAKCNRLTLITADAKLALYDVHHIMVTAKGNALRSNRST